MNVIKNIFNKIRHNYYSIAKFFVFIVAIAFVCWQMPRAAKFKYEYQLSKPWQHETLYAPFDFPIYKSEATLWAENEAAVKQVLPIFVYDDAQTLAALNNLMTSFESAWKPDSRYDKDLSLDFLLQVYDSIENQGVVAYDKAIESLDPVSEVSLIRSQVMRTVHYGDFYSMTSATEAIKTLQRDSDPHVDRDLVCKLMESALRQNVFYNADLTKQATDKAKNAVSLTYGMVQQDELIVSEGELVDEHTYNVLNSLQREYTSRSMSRDESLRIFFSQLLLVTMVFALMGLYVMRLHKRTFSELRNVAFLLLLMLLVIIPSYWICKVNPSLILIMPVSILAIMLTAFFNRRLAFAVQVFAVMLISLAVPNPFQFIFMQLVATILTTFSMSNTKIHHRFIQTAIFVFVGYVLVYLSFNFLSSSEIGWTGLLMLTLNALFILLAQPIIMMFERMFGFTTSLSLLELSNTNSPLLRELATNAPGTFQHSIQVANLCEEVLFEIGGNSLLARTGALYHDVGKISNPMYFTENQHGAYNPHNDLSNEESAQIIISHVTDGIELAHKHHIPERIIDFIRTHHGTRRTEYFYISEQKAHPGEEIDPTPFTYHGPEPFSRETAVLMMADSIEAASHSLKDPDEKKISDLVDNIINKQMEAGQFLNTDLTLRDIETCRKVLKKKLMSIYHVRIAYPEK